MKRIILIFFILSFNIVYPKEYKIGVIPKSMYTEFWKNIEIGAKVAAKEEGVTLIYRGPTYEENEKIQKEIIIEMIRLNVDAIVIAPADKNIVSDEINMAIKKGYIAGTIVQNPYKIGYTGIKKAVELLNGKKVEKNILIESEFIEN